MTFYMGLAIANKQWLIFPHQGNIENSALFPFQLKEYRT